VPAAVISRNPATGATVFRCAGTSPAGVSAAVDAASRAGGPWAAVPISERAGVLRRFADLVDSSAGELAELVTAEVGKRRVEADGEVEWTALSARWYADHPPQAERVAGAVVHRRPLGVIAVVTPWNVPLVTPAWKWLPALVAGNTVVWKPSELATGVAARGVELLRAAGLPDEVLQLVPGDAEVATGLCRDERVAGVHFTGSTRAGRSLAALVAPRFARCALEMGGVNAALVFADADLPAAADAIVAAATSINGQKCTAVRTVLVAAAAAEVLLTEIAQRVAALTPGDPAEPRTTLGPLISEAACARAGEAVAAAVARGGRVVARSPAPAGAFAARGTFFPATVLTDLPADDALGTEEVFAPVLTVQRFGNAEEAWQLAARSGYGLGAAVYTADQGVVAEATRRLAVGVLTVNRRADAVDLEAPFGGRGLSGNGFPEGGSYVYSAVTDRQAVYGDAGGPG